MKLSEFIDEHVLTDPEWRDAYDESELRRESGRMLARARREQGISQAQLAGRCGTDQAVISRIERGVVSPSLDTLWRVSAGLGMRPVLRFEAMSEPGKTGRRVPKAGRATVRVGPKETVLSAVKASGSKRTTARAGPTTGEAVGQRAAKVPTGTAGKATREGTRVGRRQTGGSVDPSPARQDPS
jgi:transcriptional regulator with XRE-family HTH domain